jgi:hypothetical protein
MACCPTLVLTRIRGPDDGQIARAKELAEDLLVVLRIEHEKARQGAGGVMNAGVYQPGLGTYAPAPGGQGQGQGQGQGGDDAYAQYYAVSLAIVDQSRS